MPSPEEPVRDHRWGPSRAQTDQGLTEVTFGLMALCTARDEFCHGESRVPSPCHTCHTHVRVFIYMHVFACSHRCMRTCMVHTYM